MDDLEDALGRLRRGLVHAKDTVDSRVAAMAAGNVTHKDFDMLLNQISGFLRLLDQITALTGIGQFIRNFYGNQAIDLAAHKTAIVSAAETVAATIRSSAPTGAQSFILGYQYDPDPRAEEPRVWRTYTPTQTETIRTQLGAFSTAITNFFLEITGQA